MDAHRHPLGQPDPLESRTDRGQQFETRAAVLLGNAPADAVDTGFDGAVGVSHQGDHRPVAAADAGNRIFLEKPVDPIAVHVNQGHHRLVGDGLAAQPKVEIGDVTVHRRMHPGELQVELGLLDRGHCRPELRVGVAQCAQLGLRLGQGGLGFGQSGPCLVERGHRGVFLLQRNLVGGLGPFQRSLRGGLLGQQFLLSLVLGLVFSDGGLKLGDRALGLLDGGPR